MLTFPAFFSFFNCRPKRTWISHFKNLVIWSCNSSRDHSLNSELVMVMSTGNYIFWLIKKNGRPVDLVQVERLPRNRAGGLPFVYKEQHSSSTAYILFQKQNKKRRLMWSVCQTKSADKVAMMECSINTVSLLLNGSTNAAPKCF